MQYFGVPTCPYCKKRVNLIRTWSLKRQGEYQCPRCSGISNIYLSPLIYVFALLAVFAGGAVYFFHKFILDDISLSTVIQVLVPFAVFFLLSLFMVYLQKPVIKKVSRAEMEKKKRNKNTMEDRRASAANTGTGRVFYDSEEYLPEIDYRTGPMPQMEEDVDIKIHASSPEPYGAYGEEMQRTSVMDMRSSTGEYNAPRAQRAQNPAYPESTRRPAQTGQPAAQRPAQRQAVPNRRPAQRTASTPRAEDVTARSRAPQTVPSSVAQREQGTYPRRQETSYQGQYPVQAQQRAHQDPARQERRQPARAVSSVEIPSSNDDFFAKYDDPAYIERRLQELRDEQNGKG